MWFLLNFVTKFLENFFWFLLVSKISGLMRLNKFLFISNYKTFAVKNAGNQFVYCLFKLLIIAAHKPIILFSLGTISLNWLSTLRSSRLVLLANICLTSIFSLNNNTDIPVPNCSRRINSDVFPVYFCWYLSSTLFNRTGQFFIQKQKILWRDGILHLIKFNCTRKQTGSTVNRWRWNIMFVNAEEVERDPVWTSKRLKEVFLHKRGQLGSSGSNGELWRYIANTEKYQWAQIL